MYPRNTLDLIPWIAYREVVGGAECWRLAVTNGSVDSCGDGADGL